MAFLCSFLHPSLPLPSFLSILPSFLLSLSLPSVPLSLSFFSSFSSFLPPSLPSFLPLSLSFFPSFFLSLADSSFFLFYFIFIYLFLAALGLRCCVQAFSSCGEWGLLFVAVRGLLIAVASLVEEHGL